MGFDVDFDILNQRGTPAFFADAFANRPAPGFVGRIFVDTDNPSSGMYRDTGTIWVRISVAASGGLQDLQSVLAQGNLTNLPAIFDNSIAIGTSVLSPNIKLDVQDVGTFVNQFTTSFINREYVYNAGILLSGPAYGAITTRHRITLNGGLTVPNGVSSFGADYAGLSINLQGNTLNVQQASGIRAVSNYKTQIVIEPGAGTLTHVANVWISSFFEATLGGFTGTIQNAYGLLISDLSEQISATVFTNRWAIYQSGINDVNYFAGQILAGTNVTTPGIDYDFDGKLRVQGGLHVGGGVNDASAEFEINKATKGTLLTRGTTAQRIAIATPAQGLLHYDTGFDRFFQYATTWQRIATENDLTTWLKFSFNSIPDFVVVGGSGVQDLGAGTTGMFIAFDINTNKNLYREDATNFYFDIKLITHEQFGGIAINTGVRVVYSSAAATATVDNIAAATRVAQFGTNFANQNRTFTVTVPKVIGGQPTNYFKISLIVNRIGAGNTSIIGAAIAFNYV